MQSAADSLKISRTTLYTLFDLEEIDNTTLQNVKSILGIDLTKDAPPTPGDQLRLSKAITPTEDEGLYYIPIAAQAGYALHYQDPMYLNELERLYIPGNPFKGDRFRYFEIEGDSMYPTLKDGMQVIAEKVGPEYWKQIADYYIYIVVTVDQVLAKRLIKIDDDLLAMVSDNDELYPQQELKYTDVKEICRRAGFVEPVLFSRTHGGKLLKEYRQKWELTTSHTMRRSFATNALKMGVPEWAVMAIGGWKSESAFKKYKRMSETDAYDAAVSSDFYKTTM